MRNLSHITVQNIPPIHSPFWRPGASDWRMYRSTEIEVIFREFSPKNGPSSSDFSVFFHLGNMTIKLFVVVGKLLGDLSDEEALDHDQRYLTLFSLVGPVRSVLIQTCRGEVQKR